MDKYEIAKEITLAAINNKYFPAEVDKAFADGYEQSCKGLANNIAAFFNELVDKININD